MKAPRWAPFFQAYSQSLLGFIGFLHEKCSLSDEEREPTLHESDEDRTRKE